MTLRMLFVAAALAAPLALNGCATPATSQAMTVRADEAGAANPRLKGGLTVTSVTGGKATNPMWTSQVDNDTFKKALEASLAGPGYLAAPGAGARYAVSAEMVSLNQPLLGFTFEVKSKVNYTLSAQGVDRRYPIEATGTASTSDAFVGTERLRIANERSILANIKAFLKELSTFAD